MLCKGVFSPHVTPELDPPSPLSAGDCSITILAAFVLNISFIPHRKSDFRCSNEPRFRLVVWSTLSVIRFFVMRKPWNCKRYLSWNWIIWDANFKDELDHNVLFPSLYVRRKDPFATHRVVTGFCVFVPTFSSCLWLPGLILSLPPTWGKKYVDLRGWQNNLQLQAVLFVSPSVNVRCLLVQTLLFPVA